MSTCRQSRRERMPLWLCSAIASRPYKDSTVYEGYGRLKILIDRDNKQILDASFLGLEGDEAIHCVLDILYAKARYTVTRDAHSSHSVGVHSDYDG
jgi:pyruvate/2-oxoglutarate dehydrogenase complex dihydrolipoamide dehydrogenase (E3) component